MARPLRVEFPEALYHVTARGIEKKSIFESRDDKGKLLERIAAVHERYGFVFYACCWRRHLVTYLAACRT